MVAQLDRIKIEGYRSIRDQSVELGALNIVIGANGSGKSNLVGALGLLGDIVERRLQLHVGMRGGADAILHFGSKQTKELRMTARFGDNGYAAVLVPAAGDTLVFSAERTLFFGHGKRKKPYDENLGAGHKESLVEEDAAANPKRVSHHVLQSMRGWRVFQFHDTSSSASVKQKHALDDNRTLRHDGGNLAPLLYRLKRRAPAKYRAIVEVVQSIAPFFDDFILEPDAINPRVIQLEWRHRSEPSVFYAHQLSDGTLRFMCLAALLLQPTKPSVIVIDEPELGLHPAAIVQLSELMRIASRECQIIAATQSVTLLDQFDVEDVIVVQRSNGTSTFDRLDAERLRTWLEDYSLGELWLKNVLGGRPQ